MLQEFFLRQLEPFLWTYRNLFLGGSVVENPPANAGDARTVGSSPGWWWWCFFSGCVYVFLSLYFMLQALPSCLICSVICSYLRRRGENLLETLNSEMGLPTGNCLWNRGSQTFSSMAPLESQSCIHVIPRDKGMPRSFTYQVVRSKELTGSLHDEQQKLLFPLKVQNRFVCLFACLLIFLMFNLFAVVVGFKGGVKLDMLLPSLTFPIICSFSRVLTCQGLIECQD